MLVFKHSLISAVCFLLSAHFLAATLDTSYRRWPLTLQLLSTCWLIGAYFLAVSSHKCGCLNTSAYCTCTKCLNYTESPDYTECPNYTECRNYIECPDNVITCTKFPYCVLIIIEG